MSQGDTNRIVRQNVQKALAAYAGEYEVRRELPSRGPNGVFEVLLDGERAVCKVADCEDAHIHRQALVVEAVAERTDVPTPDVLSTICGCVLFEWSHGCEYGGGQARNLRQQRLRNAGRTLAELHTSTDFAEHGYLGVENEGLALDSEGGWGEMLGTITAGWCEDLAGTRFESAGQSVRGFIETNCDRLERADGPDLVHGDFQPANVQFSGAEVVGVLDWEFSFVGAGEFDLCRAEREFFDWHTAPETDDSLRDALYAGYESVRPLPQNYAARRHVYRAVLKLDPMRAFDAWKSQVEDPETTAESMITFVQESLRDARSEFGK
jgi:Ser/Thr protein kinase RdoA (MazF antagonist)